MAAPAETRIVVLGKTGSGKSSVGNLILGEVKFKAKSAPNSASKDCQTVGGNLNGRKFIVTDTPGIFDTEASRSEEDLKNSIISCLTGCASGPHVFILVMKVGRYTKEEKESVKMVLKYFGEEALKHTVVLFTHGENLCKKQTINNFVERSKDLKELVDKCGGRVHVIDSKHWNKKVNGEDGQSEDLPKEMKNRLCGCGFRFRLKQRSSPSSSGGNLGGSEYRSNSFQINQLLRTIDTMVKNNDGNHYINKTLQVTAEAIDNEVKKIKEETEERGEIAKESEIREQATETVKTNMSSLLAGSTTGAVLGALLSVPVGITIATLLIGGLTMKTVVKVGVAVNVLGAGAAGTAGVGAAGTAGAGAAGTAGAGAVGTAGAVATAGAAAAIGTGVCLAAGAVLGAAVGAEAAKTNNVGEAAGQAARSVMGGAWNIVKETWEFSSKMESGHSK